MNDDYSEVVLSSFSDPSDNHSSHVIIFNSDESFDHLECIKSVGSYESENDSLQGKEQI